MNWKDTALKAAAAVFVYALTFIGPVEQFLSSDRLLLLSAVELGCLSVVLWQLFQIVRHKMTKHTGARSFGKETPLIYAEPLSLSFWLVQYMDLPIFPHCLTC